MPKVKENDTVSVIYKGSLVCGIVFDFIHEEKPFEFTLGMGITISGFEKALIGMEEGTSKKVKIVPEDAFGNHSKDLIITMDRSQICFKGEPKLGMMFHVPNNNINNTYVEIIEIHEDIIKFDANHTLAGKCLIYEITLLKIISKDKKK